MASGTERINRLEKAQGQHDDMLTSIADQLTELVTKVDNGFTEIRGDLRRIEEKIDKIASP